MKILMVSSFYYPVESGVEVFAREIAERLVKDGHTVYMITGNWNNQPKEETLNGVKIYRVAGKLKRYLTLPSFYLTLSASNLFQKLDYDLIHAHSVFPPALAARLNKKAGKPMVITVQGGDVGIYKNSGTGKFFWALKYPIRGTLKRAKVTAISNYLACKCEELGAKDVTIIRNGCDTSKFIPSEDEGDYILTVSRLVPKNGIEKVIAAFKLIQDEFPKLKLVVVGDGYMRRELEELAEGSNIAFTGFLEHDKLPEIMAKARLFIRLSTDEGLGIVFAEAMACKVPVVATAVGGIPELIDEESGFLVEPNDVYAAADAMRHILTHDNWKMTQRAYEKVIKEFSWDSIYANTLKVYNEVLKNDTL